MLRDAAGLAWVTNLGNIDLNPHPVRADDLDHPDELRIDLDPVPGIEWPQIRQVALVAQEALADVGLVGWPKTSGSRGIHINVRIERRWTYGEVRRAALAIARDVERRAPGIATSKWWKEERHGVFLDYNQNAKDRTVASAYRSGRRRTPASRCRSGGRTRPPIEAADFTLVTVPAIFAERGDAAAGIDEASGSLDALLELSARHEAEGMGDAPWPPTYRKAEGEPPRVQPSRQRRPDADYNTPEAEAEREKARIALERRLAPSGRGEGRVHGHEADADGPAQVLDPGHRDLPGREEGRRAGRPRALEGAPPGGRGRARTGRRPGRRDARTLDDVVPRPREPDARARSRATSAGAARSRLRPLVRVRVPRPRRAAGPSEAPPDCRGRSRRLRDAAEGRSHPADVSLVLFVQGDPDARNRRRDKATKEAWTAAPGAGLRPAFVES